MNDPKQPETTSKQMWITLSFLTVGTLVAAFAAEKWLGLQSQSLKELIPFYGIGISGGIASIFVARWFGGLDNIFARTDETST